MCKIFAKNFVKRLHPRQRCVRKWNVIGGALFWVCCISIGTKKVIADWSRASTLAKFHKKLANLCFWSTGKSKIEALNILGLQIFFDSLIKLVGHQFSAKTRCQNIHPAPRYYVKRAKFFAKNLCLFVYVLISVRKWAVIGQWWGGRQRRVSCQSFSR